MTHNGTPGFSLRKPIGGCTDPIGSIIVLPQDPPQPHHRFFCARDLMAEVIEVIHQANVTFYSVTKGRLIGRFERILMAAPSDVLVQSAVCYDLTVIFKDLPELLARFLSIAKMRTYFPGVFQEAPLIENYIAWMSAKPGGAGIVSELRALLAVQRVPIPDAQPFDPVRQRYTCTSQRPRHPEMLGRWEHDNVVEDGEQIDYSDGDSFQPMKCLNCGSKFKEELSR